MSFTVKNIIKTSDDLIYDIEISDIIRKIQEKYTSSDDPKEIDIIIFLDKKGKEFCTACINKEFVHIGYIDFFDGGFCINYLPMYCLDGVSEFYFNDSDLYLTYRQLIDIKINEEITYESGRIN